MHIDKEALGPRCSECPALVRTRNGFQCGVEIVDTSESFYIHVSPDDECHLTELFEAGAALKLGAAASKYDRREK